MERSKPASVATRLIWLSQHCDDFRMTLNGRDTPSEIIAQMGIKPRRINFVPEDLAHAVTVIFTEFWPIYEARLAACARQKQY
jgi:hypothetical protein